MSLKGNRFAQQVSVGVALSPQSINNTTVNGATIADPWRDGRIVSFLLLLGALPATTAFTVKVQHRARVGGAWSDMQNNLSTPTDLQFTAASTGDDDDDTALLGELDLRHVDTDTYDAIRIVATNGVATAGLIAVAYIISDVYTHPSGQVDDFNSKLNP